MDESKGSNTRQQNGRLDHSDALAMFGCTSMRHTFITPKTTHELLKPLTDGQKYII